LDSIYSFPYQVTQSNKFEKALIIGSGMGNDVAVALKNGVKEIDAVDIDPEIYKLGLEFNSNKPYQNPAVTFYNDDGRSFLTRSANKYDLIIFAMPDTLFLTGGRGNIRLESFLFTKESFQSVKSHLKENGLVVLYNYYRQSFIVDKLALTLDEVFGQKSYVLKGLPPIYPAAIMNGEALKDFRKDLPLLNSAVTLPPPPPAIDDWPFLYIQKPHIPSGYLTVLLTILLMVYFLISKVIKKPLYKFIKLNYFFLGVGFFLMETKSIVQFSLLFGATWLTNSLVTIAILISVFLATQLAVNIKISSTKTLYTALFLALCVQYFFPINTLLGINPILRYLTVSVVTFAPVFIANVIFSFTFKGSKENSINFASNMFGAVVGGVLEYLALIMGYRNLILIIALCYLLAFSAKRQSLKAN
jgi:hypothetical protein